MFRKELNQVSLKEEKKVLISVGPFCWDSGSVL